jgi:hypothetical protein
MRKLLVVLAVILTAALTLVGITGHSKAGVFAPGTPGPPAGYTSTYAHNFTTQGNAGWVIQPGAGAHVSNSKSFGLGIGMTSVNQWAEAIGPAIGPNSFVKALVYIPAGTGKDGLGRSYPTPATANWPAWWTAGNPWPENGEIDALEGLAGHSSFHGFYGPSVAGKISTPNFNATPNSIGTGWFTLSFLRTGGQVTAWYGTHKVGTFKFPPTASETLRFQNQSYSTGTCSSCFGPTVLGAKSTAWLSRVQVWSKPAPKPVPTPTPTVTKTTPPPTPTPTPTMTTPAGFACVKQDNASRNDGDFATCPAPGLSGGSNQSDVVTQDIWNKTGAFSRQDLSSNGAGDWQVQANMASGNTAVESYPDTQDTVTLPTDKPAPISGYTSVKSTYSTTLPGSPGATDDYEAAYDIWLSDSTVQAWTNQKELMIWTDTLRQRPAGNDTGQTWTDASTGKVYEIWANSGTISLVAKSNANSGSVDLLALYKFLEAHTFNGFSMPANAGVDQVGYGFEVCSTSGQTETFAVHGYTLNATGSGV